MNDASESKRIGPNKGARIIAILLACSCLFWEWVGGTTVLQIALRIAAIVTIGVAVNKLRGRTGRAFAGQVAIPTLMLMCALVGLGWNGELAALTAITGFRDLTYAAIPAYYPRLAFALLAGFSVSQDVFSPFRMPDWLRWQFALLMLAIIVISRLTRPVNEGRYGTDKG
jgi:hypothetical protein